MIARAEAMKQQILDTRDQPATERLALEPRPSGCSGVRPEPEATEAPGALEPGLIGAGQRRAGGRGAAGEGGRLGRGAVLRVVEQHRTRSGSSSRRRCSTWDPRRHRAGIELLVGRDLQFVRINGTLVGGLVGLLLYTISRLAGYSGVTRVSSSPCLRDDT